MGRIGREGVNGVRERLCEEMGRSLDPDEIEYEMSRDKGFGGLKKTYSETNAKVEKKSKEMTSGEDFLGSHSERPLTEDSMSDDGDGGAENQ